jgi:hypothetical protein
MDGNSVNIVAALLAGIHGMDNQIRTATDIEFIILAYQTCFR